MGILHPRTQQEATHHGDTVRTIVIAEWKRTMKLNDTDT